MSNAPTSPPPGSVPGGMSPSDMEGLMDQTQMGSSANPAQSTTPSPASSSSHSSKTPRPIASLPQEGKYLAQDVGQGMLELLPDFMQRVLGIKNTDTPEEKAKKQQMFQNYQQLSAEDQAYVQKKMQREEAEKQQREQEEEMRKQQEMANQSSDLPMPAGKVTGEAAAGASNKQRTTQKLQNDRKKLSNAG